MSRFVHIEYPARHPGVARLERTAKIVRRAHIGHYVLATLAVIGKPVRKIAASLGTGVDKWAEARRQAKEDEKLWNLALTDARVMADLSRAMGAEALSIKRYY
jgi:hypothetical protein